MKRTDLKSDDVGLMSLHFLLGLWANDRTSLGIIISLCKNKSKKISWNPWNDKCLILCISWNYSFLLLQKTVIYCVN